MADRVLRGSRLGAMSYESDRNADLAPRQPVTFDCPVGHSFVVPFAEEADVPATWECRTCGRTAQQRDAAPPEAKKGKPPRTHWDMLMERRSEEDLEEVLSERLEHLRSTRAAAQEAQAAQAPRDV